MFKSTTNLTYNLLFPALKLTIPRIADFAKLVNISAVGIDDFEFNYIEGVSSKERIKLITPNSLYVCVDKNGHSRFGRYVNKIEGQANLLRAESIVRNHYSQLYPLNCDITGDFRVFQFPINPHFVSKFIEGKYSEIYQDMEIPIRKHLVLNGQQVVNPAYKILTKDESLIPVFIKELKEKYGKDINIKKEELYTDGKVNRELCLPPNLEYEIFNFY